MKETITSTIELPEGVTAQLNEVMLTVKGPKGEVKREFIHPRVKITVIGDKLELHTEKATKREKTMTLTFSAHIKNMLVGVQIPHTYKLKICSGHFPMNVTISNNVLTVKNFLGESVPRKVSLPVGALVAVNSNEIVVTSPDIELAGIAASRIENLCRITNRDRRIFQDGIYITQKSRKVL